MFKFPKNVFLLGAFTILIVSVLYFMKTENANTEEVKADTKKGFTSDVVIHDGLSFELVRTENKGTTHTFQLKVINISNKPKYLSSNFSILSGERIFDSKEKNYSTEKLNPNMEAVIEVTFEMNLKDLINGEPLLEIDRGFLLKNTVEVALVQK